MGVLSLASLGLWAWGSWRPFSPTAGGLADPTNTALVAAGRAVYERHCAVCHRVNREGQAHWQRPLPTGGYPAPPHDETGRTWHHSDRVLFEIMQQEGQASAPRGSRSHMPAFKEVLADADIWAVLAYIKSRWAAHIRAEQARHNTQSPRPLLSLIRQRWWGAS